jgi:predicted RNase H-like nuclease (RuvC/YqgF family)
MRKKQLVVAGIDPGTTAGLCLLDLDGRILTLQSSKGLTMDKIIEKTVHAGRLVLVGCDKRNVPEFVSKYATQFRARIKSPNHDLTIEEKRELVGRKNSISTHEFDSLACALFALKEAEPLLRKVRALLKQEHREEIFSEVAEIAIKQEIAVRLAFDMATKPKEETVHEVTKAIAQETVSKERIQRLYDELGREKEMAGRLKNENLGLEKEIARQKSFVEYLKKKMKQVSLDDKTEEIVRRGEDRVRGMRNQMRAMNSEISELKRELDKQRAILADGNDRVIAKRVRNLGKIEFEKKQRFLKIKKHDVLVVDDPSIYSESVLDKIMQQENILIMKKTSLERLAKGIIMLESSKVQMTECRHFAAIDRKSLERIKSDRELLRRIVKDYQESRS